MPNSAKLDSLLDQEIVARVLAGDPRAEVELVRRYEPKIKGMIYKKVKNREVTDELTQDTFLKVFQQLPTYRAEYPFFKWIYTIAGNTVIDHLRKKKKDLVPIEEAPDLKTSTGSGDGSIPSKTPALPKIDSDVKRNIKQLRWEVRQCIELRYEEHLSLDEIARRTGLPVGTVKTHLHRGPKKVRVAVSQERKRKRHRPSSRDGT